MEKKLNVTVILLQLLHSWCLQLDAQNFSSVAQHAETWRHLAGSKGRQDFQAIAFMRLHVWPRIAAVLWSVRTGLLQITSPLLRLLMNIFVVAKEVLKMNRWKALRNSCRSRQHCNSNESPIFQGKRSVTRIPNINLGAVKQRASCIRCTR